MGGALEYMIIFTALGLLAAHFAPQQTQANWERMGQVAAWEQKMIWRGIDSYVRYNWSTVYADASSPTTISISTLQAQGYIPANVGKKNPWGQTWVVTITNAGTDQLFGYLATTGGAQIPVQVLSKIASWTGEYGAYTAYSGDPNACGASPCASVVNGFGYIDMSPWNTVAGAIPTTGHLVNGFYYTNGQASSQFLCRFNTGNPEDCTMHTDILVNNNNILGANQVTATTFADSGSPTSFFLKPAGTSKLNTVDTQGDVNSQGNVYGKHFYLNP